MSPAALAETGVIFLLAFGASLAWSVLWHDRRRAKAAGSALWLCRRCNDLVPPANRWRDTNQPVDFPPKCTLCRSSDHVEGYIAAREASE